MSQLKFTDDGLGNLSLSNQQFDGVEFADITIAPPRGKSITLSNVRFIDCKVAPGSCVITSGVVLDDVVFKNFDCGDALRISSEATVRKVVVAGERPLSLVVQPEREDHFIISDPLDATFQFDISEFAGSVCIVGVRGDFIQKDPSRHVVIKSTWKNDVDWKSLGIGPFSYWRIFLKKLSVFNATEGVFSLPPEGDKHHSETMREKENLEQVGVRFD